MLMHCARGFDSSQGMGCSPGSGGLSRFVYPEATRCVGAADNDVNTCVGGR